MTLNKESFQQFKEDNSELARKNNLIYLHKARTSVLGPNLNTRPDIKPVIRKNNISFHHSCDKPRKLNSK